MNEGSLADFLKRAVLDRKFRELARREPGAAFHGYELTDEQKDILVHGDERMLALLGQVVQPTEESEKSDEVASLPDHPAKATACNDARGDMVQDAGATAQRSAAAPGLKFVLRLTTQTHRPESSNAEAKDGAAPELDLQISYSASFRPWNEADATKEDKVDNASPDVENAAGGPSESAWLIQLNPHVVRLDAQRLALSYAATIRPLMGADVASVAVPESDPARSSWSPWNHQTAAPAVREAADNVRGKDGEQRFDALCALIKVMQRGGVCG